MDDSAGVSPEDLEKEFQKALLDLLSRARRVAKVAAIGLLNNTASIASALATAKEELCNVSISGLPIPGKYFIALYRRKRLDLSIEVLALTPPWPQLFSTQECAMASERLQQFNYAPALTASSEPIREELPLGSQLRGVGGGPLSNFWISEFDLCEQVRLLASSVASGEPLTPAREHRQHLRECSKCREAYPKLQEAYEDFDRRFEALAAQLFAQGERLDLGEERINQLAGDLDDAERAEHEEAGEDGFSYRFLVNEVGDLQAARAVLLIQLHRRFGAKASRELARGGPPAELSSSRSE